MLVVVRINNSNNKRTMHTDNRWHRQVELITIWLVHENYTLPDLLFACKLSSHGGCRNIWLQIDRLQLLLPLDLPAYKSRYYDVIYIYQRFQTLFALLTYVKKNNKYLANSVRAHAENTNSKFTITGFVLSYICRIVFSAWQQYMYSICVCVCVLYACVHHCPLFNLFK